MVDSSYSYTAVHSSDPFLAGLTYPVGVIIYQAHEVADFFSLRHLVPVGITAEHLGFGR